MKKVITYGTFDLFYMPEISAVKIKKKPKGNQNGR